MSIRALLQTSKIVSPAFYSNSFNLVSAVVLFCLRLFSCAKDLEKNENTFTIKYNDEEVW